MSDLFPYKFNVSSLEYADVVAFLQAIPSYRYTIARREMVGELTLDEWREVKAAAAAQEAIDAGDDHQVQDDAERAALIATDSNEKVPVVLLSMPTVATRRLLNRVAIQVGVNNAGISREDYQTSFARGVETYLVQFSNSDDAILFKLAMWKRPSEEA